MCDMMEVELAAFGISSTVCLTMITLSVELMAKAASSISIK